MERPFLSRHAKAVGADAVKETFHPSHQTHEPITGIAVEDCHGALGLHRRFKNWRRLLRGLVFRRRRLLPRLLEPEVVRPTASLAEKRGVHAVARNLLHRLVTLWTTYDRIHA
jgi:hypothetical protein